MFHKKVIHMALHYYIIINIFLACKIAAHTPYLQLLDRVELIWHHKRKEQQVYLQEVSTRQHLRVTITHQLYLLFSLAAAFIRQTRPAHTVELCPSSVSTQHFLSQVIAQSSNRAEPHWPTSNWTAKKYGCVRQWLFCHWIHLYARPVVLYPIFRSTVYILGSSWM